MNWYTVDTTGQAERLLGAWPDAPTEQEELCSMLLEVAKEQVIAFAPASALADEEPPARLVYAQLQQARTLWAAGRADENGNGGMDGFSFVPRPLDKTIRTIIRPTSGVPSVF